jgi:hypothetical protein
MIGSLFDGLCTERRGVAQFLWERRPRRDTGCQLVQACRLKLKARAESALLQKHFRQNISGLVQQVFSEFHEI